MPLFRRSRPTANEAAAPPNAPPPEELVRMYLRGQNLEQMQRTDEAAEHYEQAVTGRFDSAGPYDRLIYIYRAREDHAGVVRIADAALRAVRTFDAKRAWYQEMRDEALELIKTASDHTGPEF